MTARCKCGRSIDVPGATPRTKFQCRDCLRKAITAANKKDMSLSWLQVKDAPMKSILWRDTDEIERRKISQRRHRAYLDNKKFLAQIDRDIAEMPEGAIFRDEQRKRRHAA